MAPQSEYFSFNRPVDWEKGLIQGIEITHRGLLLKSLPVSGDYVRPCSQDGKLGYRNGYFISCALDSVQNDNAWNRIFIDVDLPVDTRLKISYYASNKEDIKFEGRKINMNTLITDETIDIENKVNFLDTYWQEECINSSHTPLKGVRGRYLWLKVSFDGVGDSSPLLKKIRVYFADQTHVNCLPPDCQGDHKDRDYLESFLPFFNVLLEGVEEIHKNINSYFDIDKVPEEFLSWLAGWLGITGVENWHGEKLRELMKLAPEIYARRGTRESLEKIINIYTGRIPFIVEQFQIKRMLENSETAELYSRLYSSEPYCFTVLMVNGTVTTRQQLINVKKILEEQRPAFTKARLVIMEELAYLDKHSYLGINTRLSDSTSLRLDQKSIIPHNALISG